MKKFIANEGLSIIPKDILFALKIFLEDNERYKIFKEQLQNTGIMIEKDGYQISVKSINELNDLIQELNTDEYTINSCA